MKLGFSTLALLFASLTVSAESTLKDGVFSPEQVDRGKKSYEANCKSCHPDISFYGDKLGAWVNTPLIDFFDSVAGSMPASAPGSLADEEYIDALAFIFSALGYPIGNKEISPYDGSMDEILIVEK